MLLEYYKNLRNPRNEKTKKLGFGGEYGIGKTKKYNSASLLIRF
jgi:hypothetical protein